MGRQRIVFLKLSGELIADPAHGRCVDHEVVHAFAGGIAKAVRTHKLKLGIAVGGGNIYRGRYRSHTLTLKTSTYASDHMGLLATVINGIALKDVLVNNHKVRAELFSSIVSDDVAESFKIRQIPDYWTRFDVLIFTGTGAPAVGRTSDSFAADAAVQIGADLLLKATKVDGIYDRDPHQCRDAKKYRRLDFDEAIRLASQVMDQEAFCRCRDNEIPIRVFLLDRSNCMHAISRACAIRSSIGTTITKGSTHGA